MYLTVAAILMSKENRSSKNLNKSRRDDKYRKQRMDSRSPQRHKSSRYHRDSRDRSRDKYHRDDHHRRDTHRDSRRRSDDSPRSRKKDKYDDKRHRYDRDDRDDRSHRRENSSRDDRDSRDNRDRRQRNTPPRVHDFYDNKDNQVPQVNSSIPQNEDSNWGAPESPEPSKVVSPYQEPLQVAPPPPQRHNEVKMGSGSDSPSSESSMSVRSGKVDEVVTISLNQNGVDKSLFSVYSYLYEEGRKRKKPSAKVFKTSKEPTKNDPDIQSELAELNELYISEQKKRKQKQKEKLMELKELNDTVGQISKEKLDKLTNESFKKPKADELPFVPVLYVKPISSNQTLNNLRETEKHNYERELKLREKIESIGQKLQDFTSFLKIQEFESRIFKVKAEAHKAAIESLEH